ncbi:MAG TPA: hypothetical protein VHJ17_11580 [Thermomonospora sp.]|nr:hypothetical protein [Thermomonospora sp.]
MRRRRKRRARQPENAPPPGQLIDLGIRLALTQVGDRAESLERSIQVLTYARDVLSGSPDTYLHAYAEYNLAMSYQERLRGERTANLHEAIRGYQRAAALTRRLTDREGRGLRGQSLGNLSAVYLMLPGERVAHIEKAVEAAKDALRVQDRDLDPRAWGVSQHNLGAAYLLRRRGGRRRNVERAISAFEAALTVRPPDGPEPALHRRTLSVLNTARAELDSPVAEVAIGGLPDLSADIDLPIPPVKADRATEPAQWAKQQIARGMALQVQFERTGDTTMASSAITCYEAALTELDEAADPTLWGTAMNNLGAALGQRSAGPEDVERAFACLETALRVRTRDRTPVLWARTQYSLALMHLNRTSGDRRDNADRAVRAAEAALEIITESMRDDHVRASHNLGLALLARHGLRSDEGDPDDLRRGIAALELSVAAHDGRDHVDAPSTRLRLGLAYLRLADVDGDRVARLELEELGVGHLLRAKAAMPAEDTAEHAELDSLIAGVRDAAAARDPRAATERFIATAEQAVHGPAPDGDRRAWLLLHDRLGRAYLRRFAGDRDANVASALTAYRAALDALRPEDPADVRGRLHHGTAEAHRTAGETAEAARHYRHALSAHTANPAEGAEREAADTMARLYAVEAQGPHRRRLWLVPPHR